MRRFLEINHDGLAFHEPSPLHPFSMGANDPPTEVLFCDCQGVGVICHHTYADGREFEVVGPTISPMSRGRWLAKHVGHTQRRQYFVDVTDQPDAKIGMAHDEKAQTFAMRPVSGTPSA